MSTKKKEKSVSVQKTKKPSGGKTEKPLAGIKDYRNNAKEEEEKTKAKQEKADEEMKKLAKEADEEEKKKEAEASAPKKKADEGKKTESRDIYVDLTEKELLEISDAAGKVHDQIRKIEDEFAIQRQVAKNKLGALQDQLDDLLKKQSTKKELRNVECDIQLNTEEGIVEFHYQGKKVDTRIMTEDDKQETFFNL